MGLLVFEDINVFFPPTWLLRGRGRQLPQLHRQSQAKLPAQKGKAFVVRHPWTLEGSGSSPRSWAELRFSKPRTGSTPGKSGLDEAKR